MTPHAGRKVTPHELQYGSPPDLSRLHTFGCRIYVYPTGDRSAKLAPHVDRGIFLGYQQTMQNILYYDLSTKQVKVNTHARFDEGMNDLPTLPLNAEYLLRREGAPLPAETHTTPALDLNSTINLFTVLANETVPISCNHATFGFGLAVCPTRRRVYVTNFTPHSTATRIRNGRRRYTGAFLVAINAQPIFSMDDAMAAFTLARHDTSAMEITITLSPEQQPSMCDLRKPYTFGINQLHAIAAVRFGSSTTDPLAPLSDDELNLLIASLSTPITSTAIEAERAMGTLTRKKLLQLKSWPEWEKAIDEQLDNMARQNMYGRNCCDGSKKATAQLQIAANTYSSFAEQPTTRLFWGIAAAGRN
jgi:hypothetical protein